MHGRVLYLEALDRIWPEMLVALRRDVYPSYIPPLGPTTRFGVCRDSYESVSQDSSLDTLRQRLQYWADHFDIRDEWLLDAALTTMCWARQAEQFTNCWDAWLYVYHFPVLELHLNTEIWLPPEIVRFGRRESWDEFRDRIISALNSQLREYRSLVFDHYGAASTQTATHAEWTARFQKRESYATIAASLPVNYKNAEETVKRGVRRFAEDVGLTLRTRHR
jgi:hypothetical protein